MGAIIDHWFVCESVVQLIYKIGAIMLLFISLYLFNRQG
jgi:hypothetical protein